MVERFAKTAGGLDILVNNAGDLIERQPFETATAEYHDNIYETNIRSIFFVTQAALRWLKKSAGCIVNVGSVAGHHGGGDGAGIYAGAKAAVATETIAMAKEFARYGIRVNTVVAGSHRNTLPPAIQRRTADKSDDSANPVGQKRHSRRYCQGNSVSRQFRSRRLHHGRIHRRQRRTLYACLNNP